MSITLINLDYVGHRKISISAVGCTFPKGGAACARPDWICRMNRTARAGAERIAGTCPGGGKALAQEGRSGRERKG